MCSTPIIKPITKKTWSKSVVAYLGPFQTSIMELSFKKINGYTWLIVFAKTLHHVWQGPRHTTATNTSS